MNETSILNDVLGPVMHGPSSSHTAASYHIGRLACDLAGGSPASALFRFDTDGSYVRVFRQQGSDLAIATGLLDRNITDDRFEDALEHAAQAGIDIQFDDAHLKDADHPNYVEIEITSRDGSTLTASAKSTGGGGITISRIDGRPVNLTGNAFVLVVIAEESAESAVMEIIGDSGTD